MTLSAEDLERIREIVRSEVADALRNQKAYTYGTSEYFHRVAEEALKRDLSASEASQERMTRR